jgi:FKBP-type peptidyl-prolyl cis-trans isomerase FklB
MKKIVTLSIVLSLVGCNQNNVETNNVTLSTEIDSVSYAIGSTVGKNISNDFPEFNLEAFNLAIKDEMDTSITTKIDPMMGQKVIQAFFAKKQKAQKEMEKTSFESVIAEGEDFLSSNGQRDGVVTLESGLQYEVLIEGNGPKPSLTDKVETHYHGTLLDGTVFDSSVDRGETISFPVNGVISGWTEALQLMPVGSKWKLFIPYNLAYGESGAGPAIGPYSTLIFDVELIAINS